jgi:hypothetical protein
MLAHFSDAVSIVHVRDVKATHANGFMCIVKL